MMLGVRLSVRCVPRPNSSTERPRKNILVYLNLFRGQKVKVQGHQPINAVADNAPYIAWGITIFLKLACFIKLVRERVKRPMNRLCSYTREA